MEKRKKWYLMMGAGGLLTVLLAVIGNGKFSGLADGVLYGLGSMFAALGFVCFCFARFGEKHPDLKKKNEIEARDERNTEIRMHAQAMAGLVIQWAVIGLAWIVILLDGPLWITLSAVGVFCGKICLETALTEYYRRRM